LAKKKDFAGAQELMHQTSPALDDHMPSVFLKGAVSYALNQLEQAEDHLSHYVATVPGNIRARKLLGATLVRNNNHAGAIDILKPLLNDNKADAQVLALLGTAYMKTGKFAEGSELFERAVKAAPDVSAIRTQLALSRLVQGSSDQAVGDLEAAIDLDPEARQASILLTLVHLRKSQFDQALEAAARLHKNMPDNPMAQNLMGAAYLGKENLAKAREMFEAALKTKSDFHPARMNLAQLDIREGNFDRAVKNYRRIIEENPKHLGALLAMADLALREKNSDKALEWLKQAGEANPKAVVPKLRLIQYYSQQRDTARALSVARGLDRTVPNNPQVLEALGRAQIAAGQPASAVSTFRSLAAIAEKSPRAHHLLGGALVAADNRPAARESFSKAIALNESFVPAIMALAELESRDGNVKAALTLAAQISKKQPKSAIGAMLTGDVHMRSKQYGKALASYEKAVEKEDTGSLALRIYNARNSLGRKEEGLRKLQQWVDRKDEPGVRSALASAYIANGRYDAAIRESEILLSTDSNNPVVLNNLAWLYDQKGDARAIDSAEKALKQSPGSPEIMDTLGWILTRHGDLTRGTQMLEAAHRAAPNQGDIAYHLAVALNKSGKTSEARRILERILKAQVRFSESANAQKLLKQLGG
jgi:putative PEP-CTERM system TPR-repeat lipoprotein